MLNLILAAIAVGFIAYEAVARFVLHNKGMMTLSHWILRFEQKLGWPARVAVAGVGIALIVHLEGGF